MDPQKKRWQIPVLAVGILVLIIVGISTFRQMTPKPAVVAKKPEKIKGPVVAETAVTTPTEAPTVARTAGAIPDKPEAELGGVKLLASDPFGFLIPPKAAGAKTAAGATTGPAGAGPGPTPNLPGVVPPISLTGIGATGPQGPSRPPVYPSALLDRTKRDTTVSLVGTIVGSRRLAIVHDESRPQGEKVRVVGEGDSVGATSGVVKDIGPGSIRLQGKLHTHTLRAEDRAAKESQPQTTP